MPTTLRLHPAVVEAREKLAKGREKLRKQHDNGTPGVQVCAHFTDLLEGMVIDLFQAALSDLPPGEREKVEPHFAVIAHSGFGRREMAPYSDLDVMLLTSLRSEEATLPVVRKFSQNLYDLGLDVGFSARTTSQAISMAMQDTTVLTSLSESRFVTGNAELFERFDNQFRWYVKRRWRKLLPGIETARRGERTEFGETVFLLEPNVKRSRGGLRDLQLVRWLGFCRFGESEPQLLQQAGHLLKDDLKKLRAARDFLLWLRNDLHFAAGKATDLLDKTEQLRLAERRAEAPEEGLLPVEQFMREYFQHTSNVREIVNHFAETCRPQFPLWWLLEPLLTHRFENDFRVGPNIIKLNKQGLSKIRGDLGEVLRLVDLANLYNKRIDHGTWRAIREAASKMPPADPDEPLREDIAKLFLSLLSQPARLGELLRRLHELRVLEQLIPGMSHARSLLQFNAYHRYTVDEHTLRAVEYLTKLMHDKGVPGEVYRGIKQKHVLHLAMLIHDLGKGYVEDHSEVGRRLAEQTGHRLGLSREETEAVMLLVHKHLRMSHLAQQHDISDDEVVVQFAVEVGSPELLQMLYVLTLADLAAVGPGVLNDWKKELLTELYQHTLRLLSSESPATAMTARRRARVDELISAAANSADFDWLRKQIESLPSSSLYAGSAAEVVSQLKRLRNLTPTDVVSWSHYSADRNVVEYAVGTYDQITPGIFHKLTGALTSQRQQILSAEINTLAEGLVLDRFYVQDRDFSGAPPESRREEVCRALELALTSAQNAEPTFKRTWQDRSQTTDSRAQHLPTRVSFDNNTAERFTIVAVFAYDRMGLLYTITRMLFELDLSVSIAKIGTHLDQVVDVFYVTDRSGKKILDEAKLEHIRAKMLAAIEAMPAV